MSELLNVVLDRQSMVPLYYQLKEQILKQIQSGVLKSGDLLPSETEMCQTYGVSRGTVRQAVNMLAEKGYVVKERGKGSCIRRPSLNHDLLGDYSFEMGILKQGLTLKTQTLLKEIIPGKKSISDRLEIDKKAEVLHLIRIRWANEEPWIYEGTYLEAAAFPGLEGRDFDKELLTKILVQDYNIQLDRVFAFVEPTMITEKYARLLQLQQDLPALVMDRVIYQQNNKPAFYSHALIRGDRCRYYFNVTR